MPRESDYEFPFCLRILICIRGAHAHKQRSRKLINDPYTIREKLPSYSKPYHKGLKQGALFVISEKKQRPDRFKLQLQWFSLESPELERCEP